MDVPRLESGLKRRSVGVSPRKRISVIFEEKETIAKNHRQEQLGGVGCTVEGESAFFTRGSEVLTSF